MRKISPPPGFDFRTVHPVASRYIDYATWPIMVTLVHTKITDEVYFRLHLIPLMEFYKRSSRTSLLGDQHISRPHTEVKVTVRRRIKKANLVKNVSSVVYTGLHRTT